MGRNNQLPFLMEDKKKFYLSQEKAKTALRSIGYIERDNKYFLIFLRREDNKVLLLKKEEAEKKVGRIPCVMNKRGVIQWNTKPVLGKDSFLDNVVFGELNEDVYLKEIDKILNE